MTEHVYLCIAISMIVGLRPNGESGTNYKKRPECANSEAI